MIHVSLLERGAPGVGRVDRVAGVIRGVRVCGLRSSNVMHGKRVRYAPDALRRAIPLYEGTAVFLDHRDRDKPGQERPYKDRVGKLVNVRFDEGGLRGDLLLNTAHPNASQLLEDAERDPGACGLSHDAAGSGAVQGDDFVISEVTKVASVDVVTTPATAVGLFESVQPELSPARVALLERLPRYFRGDVALLESVARAASDEDAAQLVEVMRRVAVAPTTGVALAASPAIETEAQFLEALRAEAQGPKADAQFLEALRADEKLGANDNAPHFRRFA